jgi:hypothetical protein
MNRPRYSLSRALSRARAAAATGRPPCVICGRPGIGAPIAIGGPGSPPHCSSSCLEAIRHRTTTRGT